MWKFATLLKKKQMVRWSDIADTDRSTMLNLPCLVETVEDWDQQKYTNVSHHFATVTKINKAGFPVLQFYNQSGDKDELLEEKSLADIYLFPAPNSVVTLDDNKQYQIVEPVNVSSLTFKLDKPKKTTPKTPAKKTVKDASKVTPTTPQSRKRKSDDVPAHKEKHNLADANAGNNILNKNLT